MPQKKDVGNQDGLMLSGGFLGVTYVERRLVGRGCTGLWFGNEDGLTLSVVSWA